MGEFVVGLYGVLQAAGLPNDGDGAVVHTDELGQAAGLELRGHQQGVRTGVDSVGPALVIHDVGAEVAPVGVFVVPEGVLIAPVAGAQHHHLGVLIHDLGQNGVHQVQSLLVGQPGDQTDDELVVVLPQPQLLLQCPLVLLLPGQNIGNVVVGVQHGVRPGIPDVVVNAVDDAPELAGVVAQVGIQLFAVLGSLDFPGVGAADGGDHVAVGQAALEHIGIQPVLGQGILIEHIVRQAGPIADGGDVVNTLEAQIVNGQHGFGTAQGRILEQRPQIHGHQRRLPVVAVDHVGDPVHVVQGSQGCLGEEAEFGNVADDAGIGIALGEELLVVDEVVDDAVPHVFHDPHIEAPAITAQVHLEFAPVDHLALVFPGNAGIAGENHLYIAVHPGQGLGQGVHHVCQAAGFHKGIALRADEGNASSGAGLGRIGNLVFGHGLDLLLNGWSRFGGNFCRNFSGHFRCRRVNRRLRSFRCALG